MRYFLKGDRLSHFIELCLKNQSDDCKSAEKPPRVRLLEFWVISALQIIFFEKNKMVHATIRIHSQKNSKLKI